MRQPHRCIFLARIHPQVILCYTYCLDDIQKEIGRIIHVLADLTVDLSDDPSVNCDLEAVARSGVEEFSRIFLASPPAGKRPIHVLYNPEIVWTDCTGDLRVYRIYLTVHTRLYAQLVFQLGHELCHIFADPRRSNWFVETCCEMVSVALLCRMSRVWDRTPPFPNWVSYAPRFEEYAENRIRTATETVFGTDSLPGQAQLREWVSAVGESFPDNPRDRLRNVIIAEMVRPLFEESVDNWDALRFLGQACTSPPVDLRDVDVNSDFEFERWLEAVPEHLKDLVRRTSDVFENSPVPTSG